MPPRLHQVLTRLTTRQKEKNRWTVEDGWHREPALDLFLLGEQVPESEQEWIRALEWIQALVFLVNQAPESEQVLEEERSLKQ